MRRFLSRKFSNLNDVRKVRGANDYIGESVTEKSIKIVEKYGYKEVIPNILENLDLFVRPLGETSDIIAKEMLQVYNEESEDRGMILRPEGTSSVIRAVVDSRTTGDLYQKYYYMGPMFRSERPQKGRYRQFYQLGIENINCEDLWGDFEVIKMGDELMSEILGDRGMFNVEINHLGSREERQLYKNALKEYLKSPNVYHSLSDVSKERLEKNVLRVLDSKEPEDIEIVKESPNILDFMEDQTLEEFENLQTLLDIENIPYRVNQRLVRGVDYYNGICFEFIPHEGHELSMSTLIGGGRYDSLTDLIMRNKKPIHLKSTGFAMGIERAMLASKDNITQEFLNKQKLAIVKINESFDPSYLHLENKIRAELGGQFASIASFKVRGKKVGKKLDELSESFSHAIIVGEDEIQRQDVQLKNLRSKQVEASLNLA